MQYASAKIVPNSLSCHGYFRIRIKVNIAEFCFCSPTNYPEPSTTFGSENQTLASFAILTRSDQYIHFTFSV